MRERLKNSRVRGLWLEGRVAMVTVLPEAYIGIATPVFCSVLIFIQNYYLCIYESKGEVFTCLGEMGSL